VFTFILKVPIYGLDVCQIVLREINEIIWRFIQIVGNHQGTVESIMAK
jgi:hypothetical protein